MAGNPQQPTDRREHGEESTPQEGLDPGTRSLVLALALLSALFFAGAIALAVGTGMLAPSASQRERSAVRPLPREWAGLDPLRPVVREPRAEGGGREDAGAAGIRGGGGGPGASNGGGPGEAAGPGPGTGPGNAGPGSAAARPAPSGPPGFASVPLVPTVVGSSALPGLPDLIGGGPDLPDLPNLPDAPGLPGLGGGGVSIPPIDVPRVPLPPIALPRPSAVVLPPIVPLPGGALPGLDPGGDGGVAVPPLLPTPELPTTPVVPPLLPLAADAAEAGLALVTLGGDAVDDEPLASADAREKPSAGRLGEKGSDRHVAAGLSEGVSVGQPEAADNAGRERGKGRRWRGDRYTGAARASGLGAAVARRVRCRLDRPRRHCRLDPAEGGDRRRSDAAPVRGDDKPATGWRTGSRRGD